MHLSVLCLNIFLRSPHGLPIFAQVSVLGGSFSGHTRIGSLERTGFEVETALDTKTSGPDSSAPTSGDPGQVPESWGDLLFSTGMIISTQQAFLRPELCPQLPPPPPPPHSCVEALTPVCDGIGGGAFGRSSRDEIAALIRRPQRACLLARSLALCVVRTARRRPYASREKAPTRNRVSWHLNLGLPSLRYSEKQMCVV